MSKDKSLDVICPVCSAWKGKPCRHTKGSKKGKRREESHGDRVRLAKVKLSAKSKEKIEKLESDAKPVIKKSAKEKLTPEQKHVVEVLQEKIEVLGKHAEFVGPVTVGPIISTYRFFPLKKTKVAHLESLAKDFAVALGAESILVKRMPGESAVGVFVPNKERRVIHFKDTLSHVSDFMQEEQKDKHVPIPLNFGMNSDGEPFVDDLTMHPHLLMAGTTGGGKSTLEHALVLSMAWTMNPDELKLIIADTKGVEFKMFKELPHLNYSTIKGVEPSCHLVKSVYEVMREMQWCIDLTQERLDLIGMEGVRNIHQYNEKVGKDHPEKKMPYVVLVIDELADIMGPALEKQEAAMNAAKLSQIVARSRASGIHVIAATQRSDVRLIKGQIKANFPTRLSFRLPSHQDSRTILNTKGAENLMTRGDMLYLSSLSPELRRLHAPWISLDDTKAVIEFIIQRYQQEHEEDEKPASDVMSQV